MGYRVAVVGGGGIAADHLKALSQMKELQAVAVADVAEQRAQQLAQLYGINAYTDYRRMLDEEKPDIAVITLPHFLHKEAALYAISASCHVMLEKPMAMNTEECDSIIAAVQSAGVKLMVGHTQHYIAENIAAKAIMQSGDLGQLVMIEDTRHVNYYSETRPGWFFEKAKAGGGIFMNLGSHSVDRIQWLTDSRVVQAKASVSYFGTKGDIEGSGLAWLQTSRGVPATICQSGYIGAGRNEAEIIFTKGMLKLKTGNSLWLSDGGEYRQLPVEEVAPPFVLQFQDMIRYIEQGIEPSASMSYSRSVIATLDAIYRSHESGSEQGVQ